MGAMSTMHVSRANALKALATIEHARLSDSEVAERLNDALREGGYSLDEVSVSHHDGDDFDLEQLERMASAIAG